MNKALKTILIISIAVLGFGFLSPALVQAANLEVQFEQTPLFSEANFMPGQDITRWVKVTNNSGSQQKIIVDTVNKSDPDQLANQLNIIIKQGGTELYSNTLTNFFSAEIYLSDLANATQTQYDFTITFNSGASNDYQGKTLGFDFIIGFLGQEGGQQQPTISGAITSGGGLPQGLTITNETIASTLETSVTITWLTSYFSTSQVIYGAEGEAHTLTLSDNAGSPPKYGYANTTLEYDISPKVTFHSVTIYGLTPGTTYYYRAVSHGSLAISCEYTFTTKGVKGWEIEGEGKPAEEIGIPEITGEIPEEITEEGAPSAPLAEKETVVVPSERGLASMLAALGMVIGQSAWKMILVILSLMGLILIGAKEWKKAREKKRG